MTPDNALCPLPAFGRSGNWRAQLLWMLEGAHADAHAVAAVLGFAPTGGEQREPEDGRHDATDKGCPPVGVPLRDTDSAPARPPVRFLYLARNESAPPADESARAVTAPDWYAQAVPLDADRCERTVRIPPLQPLQRPARFNPFLRRLCSRPRPGSQPDLPRLLRCIETGAAPRSLPLWPRMTCAPEVHLLLDKSAASEPFHDDFNDASHLLQTLCGAGRLHVAVLFDAPGARPWVRVSGGRVMRFDPPPGVPVIILADLGGDHEAGWRALGVRLRAAGGTATLLCPVLPPSLSPGLRRVFRIIDWGGRGALNRPVRMGRPLLPPDVAARAETVLAMAAAAVNLEPRLIRALRRLLPGAGAAVDRAVWRHRHVKHGSGEAVAFASLEWREHYQQAFAALPAALRERAAQVLQAHHARRPASVRMIEAATSARLLGQTDAIPHDWLARLVRARREAPWPALVAGSARLLARQAAFMWPHNRPLAALWAAHNADALHAGEAVARPPGLDDTDLPFFLAQTPAARNRPAVLQQIGGTLVLGRKAGAHGAILARLVLDTDILRIDVSLASGEVRTVRVNVGRLPCTVLELPPDVVSVGLHGRAMHLHLGTLVRPPWARTVGRDAFGLHASFSVAGVVQRCRWIPPGRFMMGSPEDEPERYDDELQHPVVLSRGYWLADTVCTQALWRAVMGDNPHFYIYGPNFPFENVSWNDVQDFLMRLNEAVPGLEVGLPSEAQWEYACRAGTQTPFSFGPQITREQVNYDADYPYADGESVEAVRTELPVMSFPPNGWGLYEMHGNVLEWCADWHGEYGSEEQTDPVGPPEGVDRMLRGGSWADNGGECRSAARFLGAPDVRINRVGFRLAPGQRSGETGQEAGQRADGQAQAERTGRAAGSPAGVANGKPA